MIQLEFKRTEIGMVPKEWEVVRLGDVCKQRNELIQPSGKGDFKFIGLEHVESGKTKATSFDMDLSVKSSKFKFYAGDILYGKLRPYLDKAVIVDFDGISSTDLIVLNSEESKVVTNFLIYIVHDKRFVKHAVSNTSGTNHPRTSWSAISKCNFGLPPLPEQEKIAEVLSTVDEAIEKTGAAIEKTVRLKKGLMQRLLTHGIGHKEFKETEIGRIPKEWQLVRIKDIGVVLTGQTPATSNRTYWDGNIPFITPVDINETKYVFKTERHVTSEGAEQIRRILPKDTVLVVCIGSTIGKTGITYIDSVVNQQINAVICNDDIDPHYTYYAITFRANLLKSFSGIAAVPIINKSLFEAQKISLPSNKKEQQKISEILSTIDSRLELLRDKKDKFERVKRGLMNDLLTGKRRLKV